MAFVDNTELSLRDIYQVHVHVLWPQKEHIFVFAELHWGDVFSSERAQIVLFDKNTVVSPPNPQVSILGTRYNLVPSSKPLSYINAHHWIIPYIRRFNIMHSTYFYCKEQGFPSIGLDVSRNWTWQWNQICLRRRFWTPLYSYRNRSSLARRSSPRSLSFWRRYSYCRTQASIFREWRGNTPSTLWESGQYSPHSSGWKLILTLSLRASGYWRLRWILLSWMLETQKLTSWSAIWFPHSST